MLILSPANACSDERNIMIKDYQEYFDFVKMTLLKNEGDKDSRWPFRSRIAHTERVFVWAKRLYEALSDCEKQTVNYDYLAIAVIFHDIGYARNQESCTHAKKSAELFAQYAKEHHFDDESMQMIYDLILNHSDKSKINDDISMEQILLFEADMLDEEGVMGIAWDLLMIKDAKSFLDAYERGLYYLEKISRQSPMRTEFAKKLWQEKQMIVQAYYAHLRYDLGLDDELKTN